VKLHSELRYTGVVDNRHRYDPHCNDCKDCCDHEVYVHLSIARDERDRRE
jgi:hypothetical protein